MTLKRIVAIRRALLAARYTGSHSLAVEVPRAALVSSPAHPPLHHRHLVHLRRCQRRVQALLSRDGAKPRGTTWSRSTRPEGELATATLPLTSAVGQFFIRLYSDHCRVSEDALSLQYPYSFTGIVW